MLLKMVIYFIVFSLTFNIMELGYWAGQFAKSEFFHKYLVKYLAFIIIIDFNYFTLVFKSLS